MAEERAQMNNQEQSNLNKFCDSIIKKLSQIINIIMIYFVKYINCIYNIANICFFLLDFYDCNMIPNEIFLAIKTFLSLVCIFIKLIKLFLCRYHPEIFLDMIRIIIKEKNNNNVEFTQAIRKFGRIFQ